MKPTPKPNDAVAMNSETPQILPEKPGEPGGEKALYYVGPCSCCDGRQWEVWSRQGAPLRWSSSDKELVESVCELLNSVVAGALAACALEAERPLREALEAIANDPIVGNETLDPAAHWYREIAKRALERAAEGG